MENLRFKSNFGKMLPRIRKILPRPQSLSNRFSPRPRDTTPVIVIANNVPQAVNQIQVQSGDPEPDVGLWQPPPEHSRWSELPFVNSLRQLPSQADQDIPLRFVELDLPDEQSNPSTAERAEQPVADIQGRDDHGNEHAQGRRSERDTVLDDVGVGDGVHEVGETRQQHSEHGLTTTTPIEMHSSPTFLKTHFDIMYYLGISPINGNGERGSPAQLTAFGIVTLLAIAFTFGRCKQFIVDEAKVGNLKQYITAWFYTSSLVLQLGFLWLTVIRYRRVYVLLQEANQNKPGIRYKVDQLQIPHWSVVFAILNIIVALMETTRLDLFVSGHITDMEGLILTQSHSTSMLFFLWEKETNGTDNYYILQSQYGVELNATTTSMGIFGMIMNFIGVLQEYTVKDIYEASNMHQFKAPAQQELSRTTRILAITKTKSAVAQQNLRTQRTLQHTT